MRHLLFVLLIALLPLRGWVGVPFGLLAMLTLVFDRMPARVQVSAAA